MEVIMVIKSIFICVTIAILNVSQTYCMDLFYRYELIPKSSVQERRDREQKELSNQLLELTKEHKAITLCELVDSCYNAQLVAAYSKHGGDPCTVNKFGFTPLYCFALDTHELDSNQSAKIKLLVTMGVPLDAQITNGPLARLTCPVIIKARMETNPRDIPYCTKLLTLINEGIFDRQFFITKVLEESTLIPSPVINIIHSYNDSEHINPKPEMVTAAIPKLKKYDLILKIARDEDEKRALRFRGSLDSW